MINISENLQNKTKNISDKILQSITLLDILTEISQDTKILTISRIVNQNLKQSFEDIEDIRENIGSID